MSGERVSKLRPTQVDRQGYRDSLIATTEEEKYRLLENPTPVIQAFSLKESCLVNAQPFEAGTGTIMAQITEEVAVRVNRSDYSLSYLYGPARLAVAQTLKPELTHYFPQVYGFAGIQTQDATVLASSEGEIEMQLHPVDGANVVATLVEYLGDEWEKTFAIHYTDNSSFIPVRPDNKELDELVAANKSGEYNLLLDIRNRVKCLALKIESFIKLNGQGLQVKDTKGSFAVKKSANRLIEELKILDITHIEPALNDERAIEHIVREILREKYPKSNIPHDGVLPGPLSYAVEADSTRNHDIFATEIPQAALELDQMCKQLISSPNRELLLQFLNNAHTLIDQIDRSLVVQEKTVKQGANAEGVLQPEPTPEQQAEIDRNFAQNIIRDILTAESLSAATAKEFNKLTSEQQSQWILQLVQSYRGQEVPDLDKKISIRIKLAQLAYSLSEAAAREIITTVLPILGYSQVEVQKQQDQSPETSASTQTTTQSEQAGPKGLKWGGETATQHDEESKPDTPKVRVRFGETIQLSEHQKQEVLAQVVAEYIGRLNTLPNKAVTYDIYPIQQPMLDVGPYKNMYSCVFACVEMLLIHARQLDPDQVQTTEQIKAHMSEIWHLAYDNFPQLISDSQGGVLQMNMDEFVQWLNLLNTNTSLGRVGRSGTAEIEDDAEYLRLERTIEHLYESGPLKKIAYMLKSFALQEGMIFSYTQRDPNEDEALAGIDFNHQLMVVGARAVENAVEFRTYDPLSTRWSWIRAADLEKRITGPLLVATAPKPLEEDTKDEQTEDENAEPKPKPTAEERWSVILTGSTDFAERRSSYDQQQLEKDRSKIEIHITAVLRGYSNLNEETQEQQCQELIGVLKNLSILHWASHSQNECSEFTLSNLQALAEEVEQKQKAESNKNYTSLISPYGNVLVHTVYTKRYADTQDSTEVRQELRADEWLSQLFESKLPNLLSFITS